MVTLQFIPYNEIEGMTSVGRIRRLLNIAKSNKIVLLQGRLKKEEEVELIKVTMEEINKEFKGIELAIIENCDKDDVSGFRKLKNSMFSFLLGSRDGLTIIGPSSVVKRIKKDPNKIELFTREERKRK